MRTFTDTNFVTEENQTKPTTLHHVIDKHNTRSLR